MEFLYLTINEIVVNEPKYHFCYLGEDLATREDGFESGKQFDTYLLTKENDNTVLRGLVGDYIKNNIFQDV